MRLRQLEKSLLQALNDAKGKILDDDSVIATLETLKKEAADIGQKVKTFFNLGCYSNKSQAGKGKETYMYQHVQTC